MEANGSWTPKVKRECRKLLTTQGRIKNQTERTVVRTVQKKKKTKEKNFTSLDEGRLPLWVGERHKKYTEERVETGPKQTPLGKDG